MSAILGLWLPVLFLANVIAVLWIVLGRRATVSRFSRKSSGLVKNKIDGVEATRIQPATLVWKNINCVIGSTPNEKHLLCGISGRASPGEVVVLMGPSGAGKSTLLDVLSMRKKIGQITGEFLVNGAPRTNDFSNSASYVPQEDNFIPSLSCLETLQLYGGLLLWQLPKQQRDRRVRSVLYDLGLMEHQHTLVGGFLPGGVHVKGLSGGQKRRLNVGTGIISSPSAVFMDELTTGLDSFTALSIMRFVKDLAIKKTHTIIATIHQPRLDIWNLFSRISLLSKGRLLFEGTPEKALEWFTDRLGFPYDQEIDGTVPEWCLDLISIDFVKDPAKRTFHSMEDLVEASESFVAVYDRNKGIVRSKGDENQDAEGSLSEHSITLDTPTSSISISSPHVPKMIVEKNPLVKFFQQKMMLSWRCFVFITRNPADVGGRLFTISCVASFLGLVFYNLSDGPESITTRFNVLFMTALVLILFPYLSVSHATADKVYYFSDVSSRLYSPLVYYISKTLVQLPFQIFNALVFVLIVYGMTGLRYDVTSLLHHLLIMVIAYLIFTQILNLAAIVAPSEDLTFMVGVCFVAFNLMFSDFFIRKDQMKFQWLSFFSLLSPMKYIFGALTYIEFVDRDFYTTCVADFEENFDSLGEDVRALIPLPRPTLSFVIGGMSDDHGLCLVSGNGFLAMLDNQCSIATTTLILLCFLAVLHLVTFGMLCFASKNPVKR